MFKKVAPVVIAVFCFVFIWLYSESRNRKAVRPPEGATNLTSFLQARPDVGNVQRFTNRGKTYLEIIGRVPNSWFSLPSGTPTYVFDKTGALVDWAADLGEASEFLSRWGNFSNAIPITMDEAKALTSHKN
jgi:hypothetical protein